MHAFFFVLKRGFHTSNAFARRKLARVGLTASRFDMLYVIGGYFAECEPVNGFVAQRDVRSILGVTSATVSRMLNALVALGLVVRERASDRRKRLLKITEEARRKIKAILTELFSDHRFVDGLEGHVAADWWPGVYKGGGVLLDHFVGAVDSAALSLGDSSACPYFIDH